MWKLIAGLALFYAGHVPSMARGFRERLTDSLGPSGYRIAVSVVSLAGLALIVWGFADYRAAAYITVWNPPVWTKHLAFLLMAPAFILLFAAYTPSHIKAFIGHPMLTAIKFWALAHLLANGDLGGMLLFGSFLAWAVASRIAAKRRGERAQVANPSWIADAFAVVGGLALWALIIARLHTLLIGVPLIG